MLPSLEDNEAAEETYDNDVAQNRVNYRSSLKGTYQLVLDGFPYSRHRIRGGTIYWRCVQFRPLKCVLNKIILNITHLSVYIVCIFILMHLKLQMSRESSY